MAPQSEQESYVVQLSRLTKRLDFDCRTDCGIEILLIQIKGAIVVHEMPQIARQR